MATGGDGNGNGGNGKGKLPPGAAEQVIEAAGEATPTEEISPAQQNANRDALKLLLQAKLDEGVAQLRVLARKHDLIWPEDSGGTDDDSG